MSALAAGVNKKRKKSDPKPQAQINKCNNEKRRREQENIYIEELAELISANFADMSSLSVKPDKCAILQETVNQIRNIKQNEESASSSDPVQQGEVSSSRPVSILSNEIYGPLLLDALDGFLFVVNTEGKVEYVTDNVSTYIRFARDEVLGKSIYNFIHHGDHARFSSSLLPMTIGWASEPANKSRSFSCRLLVKANDQEESIEEKQQRVNRYELMHISSTQLRDQVAVSDEEGADSGPCLLCVASRISHRDSAHGFTIEQFTTKLDTSGKITGIDTSGVSASYSQWLKELMGRAIQDLCPHDEVHKVAAHLRETLATDQATSTICRLRLGVQDKFVQVQTKSKFFKANSAADSDFIMATHSIIGEQDVPSDTQQQQQQQQQQHGGDPVLVNINASKGKPSQPPPPQRNGPGPAPPPTSTPEPPTSAVSSNSGPAAPYFLDHNDFALADIYASWELEAAWERPASRSAASTPRPPSQPTANHSSSPSANFAQPSPTQLPLGSAGAPTSDPYGTSFSFNPISNPSTPYTPMDEQKPDAKVLEEASSAMSDSVKLRKLLTNPPSAAADSQEEGKNKNRILKGLLNQQDEDDKVDNRGSPRGPQRNSISDAKASSSAGGNNMLLQLLNERNDDDDLEARVGIKKQNELLQQLLKDENEERKQEAQSHDLLQSLGFPNTTSPPVVVGEPGRPRKRPSDDQDEIPAKRMNEVVSSTGPTSSKLCERNKMLASLLAKQPVNNHMPIPPVPASVISATPQEILPKVSDLNKNNTAPAQSRLGTGLQQPNLLTNARGGAVPRMPMQGRPANYLNQMLSPGDGLQQRVQNRQFEGAYAPLVSDLWGDGQSTSDPILSDILDQVIDIVPDAVMTNNTEILHLLESIDTSQNNNNFQHREPISEKMAINIIQKSLMQCESAVNKSPSSPTISLPGTPPAYSSASLTTNSSQGGFPPPPNYPKNFNVHRPTVRTGAPQYAMAGGTLTNQQQLLLQQQQRKQLLQQQQEHKRRLLQQQQQQQLLIPSNATAAEISQGLQNIDSLLNNTVAPNVSLQRSASVPESQLSPGYGSQISQQNQRLNSQQPFSPHSQLASPISQQNNFNQGSNSNYQQGGARLSPHPPFNQQLSPRQGYPQANTQNANWQQQQQQSRLSVQQQQNPMLNAQLTGNYVQGPNGRGFPVQRAPQSQQRAIGSPGTVATRQSPFPADGFPPPASPTSAFNQNQYLRLQRANSAPTATTQLPGGGLGSPRPYGRDHPPPPHPYSPIPPPQSHHPMMYQDSQYCYDQTGLQIAYNGADRGRAPPHLPAGVSGSGATSEYVRQELRAVVGARTGQVQQQQQQQQQPSARSAQMLNQQSVNPADLEALGLSFEMPTSGASESPKLWGAMGSDMGSMSPQPATSRSSMEEGRGDHKSSLLQKLLSE